MTGDWIVTEGADLARGTVGTAVRGTSTSYGPLES